MSEENKAMFRQFIDGINEKDLDAIERLMDPDFLDHDLPPGQAPKA